MREVPPPAAIPEGDPRLDPIVYEEVRRLANKLMNGERSAHTLSPTALANEAYMRLIDSRRLTPASRKHFLVLAARAMRRILVDHARARGADKRGAGWTRMTLSGMPGEQTPDTTVELLALEQVLGELAVMDPHKAAIVELRFFAGLTNEEVAETLGRSTGGVSEDWKAARAWLGARLTAG